MENQNLEIQKKHLKPNKTPTSGVFFYFFQFYDYILAVDSDYRLNQQKNYENTNQIII